VAELTLIFGSDDGNTEDVAKRIQARFGDEVLNIFDVADVTQLDFESCDKIILGIPTWDFGQIQSDWEEFWHDVEEINFQGKAVAMFGLGDQFGYGDFFLDAMGMLHDVVKKAGGQMVGYWSTEGYEFDASKAKIEGEDLFVGLGLDEDQQPELSAARLNKWCAQIHEEFGLSSDIIRIED